MEITFLGTSAMVPTKERNVQAVFVRHGSQGFLFDCGEGTQRQMNIAGINRFDITHIFISHWHGDHVAGLVGLIQTLGKKEDLHTIHLHGPKGSKERMKHILLCSYFDQKVTIKITEHNVKKVTTIVDEDTFIVQAAPVEHTIPALGYSLIEKDRWRVKMSVLKKKGIPPGPHVQPLQKGKSITYKGKKLDAKEATQLVKGKKLTIIPDTAPCKTAVDLAMDADVLISEATYGCEHEEKAEKYKHLTSTQAAMLANQAEAKKLILTHFSQRYKTVKDIEEEAQTSFPNTVCAYDFMKVKL